MVSKVLMKVVDWIIMCITFINRVKYRNDIKTYCELIHANGTLRQCKACYYNDNCIYRSFKEQ